MVVREEWNVGGPIHALVEIRSERSFLVGNVEKSRQRRSRHFAVLTY